MEKVIPISPLCTVVIPSHNANYQIQVLSPGKSTHFSISSKRRPAYCHQPYLPTLCDCRIDWSSMLAAKLFYAERMHLGTSTSMRKFIIGIQITLFGFPQRENGQSKGMLSQKNYIKNRMWWKKCVQDMSNA